MTNDEFFTAIENSYEFMNKMFPWDSDVQEFIDWTTRGIKAGVITTVFDSETGTLRYYHKEVNSLSPMTTPINKEYLQKRRKKMQALLDEDDAQRPSK